MTVYADWLDSILDSIDRASVADWVLLWAGFLVIVWLLMNARAATRLAPIEVQALTHDGEKNGVPVGALSAALRERLWKIGIPSPPSVPAGSPEASDLGAVVESSGLPQAAIIAKLIQLLPRPPKYEVSGVLLGEEPGPPHPFAGNPARETPGPCGLRFWVRPAREGAPLMDTVDGKWTFASTIQDTASLIILHVSTNATTVFPIWARWRQRDALEAYVRGSELRSKGQLGGAAEEFRVAVAHEPYNALARLELANVYELSLNQSDQLDLAKAQSATLDAYLDIACQWPDLVEPRYRASIVASALASTCEQLDPAEREEIQDLLGFGAAGEVLTALRDLAVRESRTATALLRPWYFLFQEMRLRNPFEPKSGERRGLVQVVRLSQQGLRLRRFTDPERPHTVEVIYRTALVHLGILPLDRGALSWQAFYNAACFDALLLSYLDDYAAPPRIEALRDWRKKRVRARSERLLRRALKESGGRLSPEWVARDPDLEALRKAKGQAMTALSETPEAASDRAEVPALAPPTAARRLPELPWPRHVLRTMMWVLLTAGAVVAVLLIHKVSDLWLVPIVGVGAYRICRPLLEVRVDRALGSWTT